LPYLFGLFHLPVWAYVLITVVLVHVTVMGVTLYLHRDQTHRGLDLHPAVRHFFRFWLWLTTGMVTREWVAVHRKHHAKCETEDDPHSPQVLGLAKVLFEGAELYKAESAKPETVAKYGRGAPDDWIERHLYMRYSLVGVFLMLAIDLVLLGAPGLSIWGIQMLAIPVLAAGVVNGLGHHSGYRNFECKDAATNVLPWGIVMGGEELHNNHHAFPSSAKFALRRWEIDLGWLYILAFKAFGLAKVRRVAPQPVKQAARAQIDLETARALVVNRLHVLSDYSKHVIQPVLRAEREAADGPCRRIYRRGRALLVRERSLLDEPARRRLGEILTHSYTLNTVYDYRQRLQAVWDNSTLSNERLLQQLHEWCAQAEDTGIESLQNFAGQLRGYRLA
jgi:stearoyl-CoA desaturase (delta-9 desaturase)